MSTIAALATAPGQGAIAVIRISGPLAFSIAQKIFSRPIQNFKSHTAHYGHILKADGSSLDAVLLLLMKGPNSYTGEDSIEISCHGGQLKESLKQALALLSLENFLFAPI
jgi:tRNA modification GTPase